MSSKPLRDNVSRVKKTNVAGTAMFVGLRAADVFLQYALLRQGLAARFVQLLGCTAIAPARVLDVSASAAALPIGLQPYYAIIAAMAAGSSIKQIVTLLVVSEQEMEPASAITISLFNTIFNSLNTVLSVWAVSSLVPASAGASALIQSPVAAFGVAAYAVGILTEMVSELQRTRFKRDPANKGKPYAGGLFSLARHINYGGYTVWRSAYALTAGGWLWSAAVFAFFFSDFASRGVPVLDQYLSERYREKWDDIKKRVPYRLIPGIY